MTDTSLAIPPLGPILLVGCGNMAGAMLRGWLDAGLDPAAVTAVSPSGGRVPPGILHLPALPPDGPAPAIVLLGVKPQKLDEVAPALSPLLAPETLLLSILAGVELASLRRRFPAPRAIVRLMPNTPVALRRGVVGLHGEAGLGEADRAAATRLAAALGLAEWIEDEGAFDLVTALAGSGPAFLYRFVDALGTAGARLGLPEAQARRMALATVAGAAALAAASDESPAALADRVASPGGSTREGLRLLDEGEALIRLLTDTLAASVRRNAEMAAEARDA